MSPPPHPEMTASEKPSVLISAPSLDTSVNVSGVSTVVRELIETLRDKVHYAHLLIGSPQNGGRLARNAASLCNNIWAAWTLFRSNTRVFHSNTAMEPKSIIRDSMFVLVARARGMRILLHVHGGRHLLRPAHGLTGAALRMLMRLSHVVVFLSETEQRTFESMMPEVTGKTAAIYNSISLRPAISSQGTPESAQFSVVFAGRLVPEKGIETILEVARLNFEFPIHFKIYGEGPMRDVVAQQARDNPRLEFAGMYERDAWPSIFGAADVLLLPSLFGEGMPMVMLEAMSLGVISIATGLASIREMLGNEERGFVVPPNAPQAIAEAICRIQQDPERKKLMQQSCRRFALENFDGERNSQRFLALYHTLCSNRRSSFSRQDGARRPSISDSSRSTLLRGRLAAATTSNQTLSSNHPEKAEES